MDERVEKWLYDIRLAIQEIESFFEQEKSDYQGFQENLLLKRAVERNLEIIGEAVNRILVKDPEIPIDHARKIVGLRNHIIHSYDNISSETIWAVLTNHLPNLKNEVDLLLE